MILVHIYTPFSNLSNTFLQVTKNTCPRPGSAAYA